MNIIQRGLHILFSAFLLMALNPYCLAQESPAQQDVKINAVLSDDAKKPVWAGQRVSLQIEIAVPGYFASAVSFNIPDPDGVLLMPPAGHPVVSTKTIDSVRYTTQQYELRAWPMRAGQQSIPAISAHFSFKRSPLDTDEVPVVMTTSAIPFTVKLPPGAENLGTVISAHDLKLEESWSTEPDTGDVKAGTAFTRTVTFTAPDVPGMIFPPFPADKIDGVGVYVKRKLLDSDNRGTLVGVRQDKITYLAQRPGQFTIPETRFTWFDTETNQLRTEMLPARTLHVIANPDMASTDVAGLADSSNAPANSQVKRKMIAGVWLLLVILGLVFFASRNQRARGFLKNLVAPLQPVHLQPLNPTEQKHKR